MKSDPHPLRLRADDESWALFTHALKVSIPQELGKLKEEIAKRCGGLPLLFVKLAEALRSIRICPCALGNVYFISIYLLYFLMTSIF